GNAVNCVLQFESGKRGPRNKTHEKRFHKTYGLSNENSFFSPTGPSSVVGIIPARAMRHPAHLRVCHGFPGEMLVDRCLISA
ncbi:hypothetical protein RUM43_004445, partial [Polyplax serrata]